MEIFTVMETEIEKMFENIIESAKRRKSELLEELHEFKERFKKKREESWSSIKELEMKANKILEISVESERASKILQKRLESINCELEELHKNTQTPQYRIDTTDANDVIDLLLVLGSITTTNTTTTTTTTNTTKKVEDEKIYYTPMDSVDNLSQVKKKVPPIPPPKKKYNSPVLVVDARNLNYEDSSDIYVDIADPPDTVIEKPKNLLKTFRETTKSFLKTLDGRKKTILTFGKRGCNIGQLTQPRGIYFEEATQNIFVVSREQRKVCIFNLTGDFIAEFGQNVLEGPSCVTSHLGICYVTDEKLNGIFKFRGNFWNLVDKIIFTRGSREGMFKSLKGIAVDTNNLYLVDTGNNQVAILGLNLVIKSVFGEGILQQPQDIAVKDVIYVLDLEVSNCVHVFTKEGEHLRSLINTTDIVSCIPNYFSVASDGGIILSILNGNKFIVFSREGDLVYEIGGKKGSKEVLTNTQGVCITNDNRVVCGFGEGINCISIY